MNHCENCAYFLQLPEHQRYYYRSNGFGKCERIPNTANEGAYSKDAIAVAVDGEGYFSALLVLPTFGCVLWEAEEKE